MASSTLNLISDAWIPVQRRTGRDTIRPDQIADPDVLRPDWVRPDLNLGCLELLVGLVYLACPPQGSDDRANPPSSAALRKAMEPLMPAFNFLGDGPRFLQDLEPLPVAAMALYTLQAFAPMGGRGNFTSMRGGGPMVTLVKPFEEGLWPLIWANVPRGEPVGSADLDALPWMRPTETSRPAGKIARMPARGSQSMPDPEVFFGQPRRLRLVARDTAVIRVIQQQGTKYEGWRHPLTPYYRKGNDTLPRHPKPASFGYRNWRGVILPSEAGLRPATLLQYLRDFEGARCSLIVAGWAMKNMKPLDFLWSEQPIFPLSKRDEGHAEASVEAAEQTGFAIAASVRDGVGEDDLSSGAGQRAREAFFAATQGAFEEMLEAMSAGGLFAPDGWVKTLRRAALPIFDREVMPGLADLGETRRHKAIEARSRLIGAFKGRRPFGKKIFDALELEAPRKMPKQGERK